MSDPIWAKVHQLCAGYPPEFNAKAAYDLVKTAWAMGFDVVRSDDPNRYSNAMADIAHDMQNSAPSLSDIAAAAANAIG